MISTKASSMIKKSPMLGWTKAGFPENIQNTKESIKFVKRLIAIGFSHILHARTDIPDECFKPHFIGTIDCSMLKAKSNDETANKLTAALKNAMDALDQGYLRQLIIRIRENKEQQEAFESYTFNFSKVVPEENYGRSPGFNIVQATPDNSKSKKPQNKNGSMVRNIVASEDIMEDTDRKGVDQYTIYNATKMLLRKLNVALQGLQSLPDVCYMSITIGYHDDITPEDYQPSGYHASSNANLDQNLCLRAIGHVKSNFHEVQMELAAKSLEADENSSECVDKHADKVSQVEENALYNNTSIIPLQPGLDVSSQQINDSGSNVDLSHGSNVLKVCNDNGLVENLHPYPEVHSRSGNEKNARKYSEMCSDPTRRSAKEENTDVQMGNANSKRMKSLNEGDKQLEGRNTLPHKYTGSHESSRPSVSGDNANNNYGGNSLNTSRSSICSIRSPKTSNPLRRVVSVKDTFGDKEYTFDSQPKASKAKFIIAI